MSGVATPLRTRAYVDGYNLYYGCLKGTPYKWLDLLVLLEKHLLPSSAPFSSILLPLGVKYFTAKILSKAAKGLNSVSSQARYHTALRKLHGNRIELIEGYYSLTESTAKLIPKTAPATWPRDCAEALVWKLEEKQSDVNLALQVYHDAIMGDVDQVVIITNDTDIAPALKLIREHTSVYIGLVIPTRPQEREPNAELALRAHWVRRHINPSELAMAQMPRVIPGRRVTVKPTSWYARPDLLEQVMALATPIAGSRSKAFKWMEEANPFLQGQTPIDLVETEEGAAQVIAYIEQYRHYLAQTLLHQK